MVKSAKNWILSQLLTGGTIDLRTTRLNYTLLDLFRDTQLDHVWALKIHINLKKKILKPSFAHKNAHAEDRNKEKIGSA